MKLLLGFDIGSSFIKASLLDAESGKSLAAVSSPESEMPIDSPQAGFAEQDPSVWWEQVRVACSKMRARVAFNARDVQAIGISYQMHGLVLVDHKHRVLAPSIIWCDSRSTEVGEEIAAAAGHQTCLRQLLNLPGNFTFSKLLWVKKNQPEVFSRVYKFMLPGDYIAMKMTGEIRTTPSGLSEGALWDFTRDAPAAFLLEAGGIGGDIIADIVDNLAFQGELTATGAQELGLVPGIPVGYRAGDQPNNAISLNVWDPGEVAVTAGTSGVAYGITDRATYDQKSRVNPFLHVNHRRGTHRLGVLLCLNGTGILYSWLKHHMSEPQISYEEMNRLSAEVEPGARGLSIFPYGNGGERTLENRNIGAQVRGWHFNIHGKEHFYRAAQEGIAFALNYGIKIMRQMGMNFSTARAGHANMFLSRTFVDIFSTVTNTTVEMFNTDGAQGAARAAGLGVGIYPDRSAAFSGLEPVAIVRPRPEYSERYQALYAEWEKQLTNVLSGAGW